MKFWLAFFIIFCFFSSDAQKLEKQKSFMENFSDTTSKFFRYGSTGQKVDFKYKQGVNSPTEPKSKILSFKINPDEAAGAGKGPEIISKNFTHFGTYSARLKVPNVRDNQPNVGAVVGYFTYHEDDIPGLSEIDFEWLIADPTIIYIGTWTGQHDSLQRIGRTINLAKGTILTTEKKIGYAGKSTALTGLQNIPETIEPIPDYDASAKFYSYGFDWYPDRLRWWMIHPKTGKKQILWDYSGSQLGIPQNASRYRMNFWHTNNWAVETNPLSIEKPKFPFELEVDWMRFEALK
jgi:beta-glucanase (GH16 family)